VNWRNFEMSVPFIFPDFFRPFQILISEFFSPPFISGSQLKGKLLDTGSAIAISEVRKSE